MQHTRKKLARKKIFMKLFSGFNRYLYWPVCRCYARLFVKDKLADRVYRLLCSVQFRQVHGFWPNLLQPQRFTEKLWSRMLNDRDPWITLVSDKLLVRDYVEARIGSKYLIPLLWTGTNPEMIPFDNLPSRYVIKASHGCEYNIIVYNKAQIDSFKVRMQLRKWLRINYGKDFCLGIEWAYRNIKPSIIIESFIGENYKVPLDYKFYCFSGRVEFLTQHFGRFEEHKTRSFDRNYHPHEFRYQFEQYIGECPRPQNFNEMVYVAESLAADFPFIRVDLYNINGNIFFGELTAYPGGVSTKFLPSTLDNILGEKWKE